MRKILVIYNTVLLHVAVVQKSHELISSSTFIEPTFIGDCKVNVVIFSLMFSLLKYVKYEITFAKFN